LEVKGREVVAFDLYMKTKISYLLPILVEAERRVVELVEMLRHLHVQLKFHKQ
jgi:hypothetical protein